MKKLILIVLICACLQHVMAQFTYELQTFNATNTPVFTGNNFKCVGIGKFGQIWAGTQYQGLYRYDTSTKVWSKSNELTNVFVNQIQKDEYGSIWIAQSGTSGQTGGGSNTAGGVNYFPNRTDAGMEFFSTGNFLSSRNVRCLYVDTVNEAPANIQRLWVAQATYITSGNTSQGGVSKWQDTITGSFQKNYLGLQVFPNTNIVSSGTPSCYAVCGDKNEVWVGAETNYTIATGSTSQILRYDPITGQHLGGWDQNGAFDATRLYYKDQPRVYKDKSTEGILPAGFRTTAMYIDEEGRHWVGLRTGGVVVKLGNKWKVINMPSVITAGASVNFNAITSDEFGYVYIGTSDGLVVFDDGGNVTDANAYTRITTTQGLPSNNITGVAYDKGNGRMIITSDAGVTFMKFKYKVKIKKLWDYSFPTREGQPIGVAADGVSRVYLKISKINDTMPNIKSINLKLKNYTAATANTSGKLKPALVIDKYSEEASTGTASEINMSDADLRVGAPGEFWAWYVAPDDFSSDTVNAFATLGKRYDTLTLIVTYLNNRKDTVEFKMAIVRPPTLLVHGLASDPEAWATTSHNYFGEYVPFLQSPLFTYTRALKMDPRGFFKKNAIRLLGGDVNLFANFDDRLNTLQANIEEMRKLRYAANQVDYVCHSMGGCMIRSAITFYPKKFFAGAGSPYVYKNYGKGFTHKVITLDTPHEGAPVADVGDQFIPLAPSDIQNLFFLSTKASPLFFGSIFKRDETSILPKYYASEAVNNLQATEERGGVRLGRTPAEIYSPIKNHMICGDVDWTLFYEGLNVLDGGLVLLYKSLLQSMYAATYFEGEDVQFTSESKLAARASLLNMIAQPPKIMVFNFLNYINDKRGFYNFLQDGDLIVPLLSQTSGLPTNSTNVTVFKNTDTIITLPVIGNIPSPGSNAWHSAIPPRNDVGQRVFQLLNTKISSNVFGDFFPANSNNVQPLLLRSLTNTAVAARNVNILTNQTIYDTSKIKIDAPSRNAVVLSDSSINILFRVKDTTRLKYISVDFQLADSFRVTKIFSQQSIPFTVSPTYTGSSLVMAKVVYEKADGSGLFFYIDTLSVTAKNLATPQGFRLKNNLAMVTVGQPYFPEYEVKYNNSWMALPNSNPALLQSVDSPSIATFNTTLLYVEGVSNGTALLKASFNGLEDSAILKVVLPYNSNCINRSIASGNCSNPAIWSKGVVPDICDSVIINTGHNVVVDTSITIKALRVNVGGVITINSALDTLQIGEVDEHFTNTDIYGTLAISNGGLNSNGRVKLNASSTFSMSGGKITIDANSGIKEMSIVDGIALFEAASGMAAFNFSGGTLQINNPPYGSISQTINCPYDFGSSTTLILGINAPTIASKNVNGFGGLLFPNKIGKLIINAGGRTGNRQFVNKKALTVKGSAEVKTGSGIILQAPLNVQQ